MRELLRIGPVMGGECRVIRRGGAVEVSQGVPVRVSSWRERGGQKWLCLVLSAHKDAESGAAHQEVEIYVPIDVFEQRHGPTTAGPQRAYVTR